MKYTYIILSVFFLIGCDDSTTASGDCTTLQATFLEKAGAAQEYDGGDAATCDAMCDEAIVAVQALADNSCDAPIIEGDPDAPTGAVTQEYVDGFTDGFCGETGVCGDLYGSDDGGDGQ